MKPAWRGVLLEDGTIWAWPTLLMDHEEAFAVLPGMRRRVKVRWRQWNHEDVIDYNGSPSESDKARIEAWVAAANA